MTIPVKKFSVPRGTSDILPDAIPAWEHLESAARSILKTYGYQEIRTPLYEESALFKRSLGQTSDVVNKQLLELKSSVETQNIASLPQDAPSYALRPEGTASVVRSYIENNFDAKENLSKLFYLGPMFRGERPQKGRLRQFHQIGVEAIGPQSGSPYLDAEVIALSVDLLKAFGIEKFKLKINTLGSPEDKENFAAVLRKTLEGRLGELCRDCQTRFDRNVFRILDCKTEGCRKVVASIKIGDSHLADESRNYFEQVKKALTDLGIAFEVSPYLVRGLDYYTHTVFEISGDGLGSQDALGAGGRYNGLVNQLGGKVTDAVGFALGIERILLALGDKQPVVEPLKSFIVALDEGALSQSFKLIHEIRANAISCSMNYRLGSMKSQMRLANKYAAKYVLILGEDEVKGATVTLKDMQSGEQEKVAQGDIITVLKQKLKT